MKQRILKALEVFLFVILVVGFLVYVPWEKIIHVVREASGIQFWIACLLHLPVTYLGAIRLRMLAKRQGIQITRLKLFEIGLVVRFYSFFSPASTLGSILRWYKLSGGGKSAEALTAVTINRLLDVFIAVIVGLFWAVGSAEESYLAHPITFIAFLGAVVCLWLFGIRYTPLALNRFITRFETSPSDGMRKVANFMRRLSASLEVYSRFSARDLILLIFLGLAGELLSLLALVYLSQSLHIPVSFNDLGWMKSIFFLAALTPFTLAGGLGLREVSVVLVLAAFGVTTELAVAFSFLMYVRSVVISLMGGLLELFSLIKIPLQEKT